MVRINKISGMVFAAVMITAAGWGFVACQKAEEPAQLALSGAAGESGERQVLYYTCGMHPSVNVTPEDYQAGNDKCPICKMDLVPVYAGDEAPAGESAGEAEGIPVMSLSERARSLAGLKTEEVRFRNLMQEIHTVGQVVVDERNLAYVAAWIAGRLDELFVDFTGTVVKKGSPLARIYSPQLLTTQEEYLLALDTLERVKESADSKTIRNARALVEAAARRLSLWGISEEQIRELEKTRSAQTHMIISAPIGGTVIHKNAFAGKYVKEGENLYQIADLSRLWMEADIYEHEMAFIRKGQEAVITSQAYPDEAFTGRIAFIEPYLNPRTRSVKARMDVPNPHGKLKPGMYVNAMIHVHVHEGIQAPEKDVYICTMCPEVISDEPGECPECGMDLVKKAASPAGSILAVSKEAVLDTGMRKLVYIEEEPGRYIPREVSLGAEAVAETEEGKKRYYAVLAGLEEGMKVVTRAGFLIDSQSQITGQAEAIYSGALDRGEEKKPPAKHIH